MLPDVLSLVSRELLIFLPFAAAPVVVVLAPLHLPACRLSFTLVVHSHNYISVSIAFRCNAVTWRVSERRGERQKRRGIRTT